MAKKLKIWNGASWEDVTFAITPPTTNVTNSFTTNQVIDTSTSVAALRITQRGTGEALRVEDDTNPDSSPFIINADGLVGIGTTDFSVRSSTNGGAKIVTNGGMAIINYGDDSSITVARANGTSSSPTQVLANQRIAFFVGSSYFTGATSGFINNTAMNFHAAENITDVARGSFITFDTTNIGAAFRSERMRIDASGNVGIGTSSPAVKLDISGNVVLSGQSTADQYIRVGHGRSGNGYSYIDLQGDSTYSNGLRIIRLNSGANSASNIEHRGTGSLNFITQESATISFTVNAAGGGAERFNINADGRNYMTSPLSVTGANWAESMLHLTGTNAAGVNPGLSWHAPGASAMSIFHVRGTQALELRGNANVVDITSGRMSIRNIAISTSTPSGGLDGDMWAVYV